MHRPKQNPATQPHHSQVTHCDDGKKRFFANKSIYEDMARKLNINADFLMTLSSLESGWLDDHNAGLRNLFGVTNAGRNNLNFPSYQASADDWMRRYASFVQGARTMEEFANGLKKVPPNGYNTVNPTSVRLKVEQIQLLGKWSGIFLGVSLVEGPQNGRFLEKSNAENL